MLPPLLEILALVPAFRMVFPISSAPVTEIPPPLLPLKRAIRDGASAIDTATGQDSIVAGKSAVGECYAARDPAAATQGLAIMLAISLVTANGAVDDDRRRRLCPRR